VDPEDIFRGEAPVGLFHATVEAAPGSVQELPLQAAVPGDAVVVAHQDLLLPPSYVGGGAHDWYLENGLYELALL
jgi:hypothetical protein